MRKKPIPRLHAYDSDVLEFCWRWGRIIHIFTYREIQARIYRLSGGEATYRAFSRFRDWQPKIRRSKKAKD